MDERSDGSQTWNARDSRSGEPSRGLLHTLSRPCLVLIQSTFEQGVLMYLSPVRVGRYERSLDVYGFKDEHNIINTH